ncbi:hypothetical protein M8J76_005143 [Diaphorina citri]|nr:hypothetical protein M8J76_005143 [Diaphorina citri]
MHRVDFCMKHIIPPEHLKEVIQLLGEDVSNRILDDLPPYEQILASLPPHEQDKTTMNRMLTRNYSTGNAYEDLTAIACNKDILPLLALDSRQVTPQFPYLAVQEATVADALDPGATKFDSREEERLHAFSLKIMHERVKKHCLSDMTSVYTSSAENPQSVQSEDSESSQKISSTTMSPGDEELSSRTGSGSISMMKLPLDMTMAYITIVENGVKKGLTPCFVIDNAEDGSLRVGGIGRESHGKVPVKRVVSVRHNQSISDMSDMSADEESGTKPPSSSAASTPCKVNKPRGVVRQMETRAKKAASGKGPKRKVVERCGEVPPDKRPRQSSTGHEPHSQPPTTPLQSVIHHTDPSKAGPGSFDCLKSSSGEGEAEPLELMGSCFMDYDGPWESSYDMIMKSVSLTEVEGNQDLGGSNHHAAAAGGADQTPGSQQSIDSGNSLFPHDGDSRASFVGDPLLNNTQSELVKTHQPPNKATGPGIGVKRLDTAYYPDMETTLDPYQVMGDEDYLHRLGRRTTAVVKKANHQTTSINHLPCDPNHIRISPRTRSSHPVSRKATRRDPGGGGSEDTSSETSASTTPLKKPDKAREWLANEGSNNAISQLMSALYGSGGAGEGKMGAKLKDSVREKLHDLMTKAEQQGGAITKTREDSASLEGSEDHAPSDLPPSPLFPPHSSYPTVTSLSTNSLDKLSSVGPRPRKSPSHTPTGEVEVKRGPGRPRKKTRAPKSKLTEEVVLQRNSVDSIDEDPVSPLTLPDRTAEGRLRNNQFLDSLSQKLSAEPYPSGDEPHSPRDDSVAPNAKNLDIIQSVCEKLTETMKPTKSKA